jgi:hypothetical protein
VSSEEPAPFVEPRSPPAGAGRGRRLHVLAITGIRQRRWPARPGNELLTRLRADRHHGRPGSAAGHRGRRCGHRPAWQHAGAVRPQPSTGGSVTFAGTTFGGASAVSTALTATGYITAMSALA